MPTPSFSKDLTSIFNSNILSEHLKYDLACRLIGESLKVTTVSLLLYEPRTDMLTCQGNYLAPQLRSNYKVMDAALQTVIDYLSVFDYFNSNIVEWHEMTFRHFRFSVFNGETPSEYPLNEETFNKLKEGWTGPAGYPGIYRQYKSGLHSEVHELNASSLSGRYFLNMLKQGEKLNTRVEYCPIEQAPQQGRLFFDLWAKLHVVVPKEGLYYVGLPIFAIERYIGVLRLTTTTNPRSDIDELFNTNDPDKQKLQAERLNNFAQLVSLHLKTTFYLNGYRALGQLHVPKLGRKNTVRELDELCNNLTEIIRCKGCIVRVATASADQQNPPIRGISDAISSYSDHVQKAESNAFSHDIAEILSAKNTRQQDIKAINFSIVPGRNTDVFETIEYYYDGTNLKAEKIEGRKFSDFTPDYVSLLEKMRMTEIVVLRLEYNNAGFVILTNSAHKKFTGTDIEMTLLASQRIGQEIKLQQDNELIREQNKIIAQEENARLIVHQVGAPIRALSGHAQNLNDGIFDTKEVPLKISQLNKMAFNLMRQLGSLQKYIDWELKPVVPKKDIRYSLEKLVRSQAIQFQGLMAGRPQKIWTIVENPNDFFDDCTMDRGMLSEILNCLLDNAVKYSFYVNELSTKEIPFRANDPTSPGHVHILLQSVPEYMTLTVRNWGCGIDPGEMEKIFERGTRGRQGKKRSPVGSGIGLYLAKKVVDAYKGKIEVFHDKYNYSTIFKVTISHV
jgi:signal transduction histidine kinase